MLVLKPEPGSAGPAVALFGVGLVGTAISQHLVRSGGYTYSRFPFAWDRPGMQSSQLERVLVELDDQRQAVFVWAAGSGGFSLTPRESASEHMAFRLVLRAAEADAMNRSFKAPFHLVSSAGGLYEGQRLIKRDTAPQPLREYGRLKLAQEADLLQCAALTSRIYRPTSVYGPISESGRQGLIPTLVSNGLSQTLTILVGDRQTLRDYVLVEDIGRFISGSIQNPTSGAVDPMILASGRPVTLDEIVSSVEQQLRRRVFVAVGPPTNAQNITFHSDSSPPGFEATDLQTGIRWIYDHWLQQGARLR